eukprot:Gb_08082 [translate_table: standard]
MGVSVEDEDELPSSNPLPPPPRPSHKDRERKDHHSNNVDGLGMSNLSNADFRRMVMETPRRVEEHSKERPRGRVKRLDDEDGEAERQSHRKHKPKSKEEEKQEEPELPKYRDRAKERREDQNPDYEPTEMGSLHAVAPPGTVDLRTADAHRISIENSKYLGGDVEHTHLVKGLDYALLHKVRSEIDKKPENEDSVDGKSRTRKEDQTLTFRTATSKLIYRWIVKPQSINKPNEMFLPGRTVFVYDMDDEFSHDIPTTVHRSKADCPAPQETVTVGVDGSVLERIAKIMSYLRLGSSGKVLKKKKKEKAEGRGKGLHPIENEDGNDYEKSSHAADGPSKKQQNREMLPPPPPRRGHEEAKEAQQISANTCDGEDDIFEGAGTDYTVPGKNQSQSPLSEDMEESPRDGEKQSYFNEPVYGPAPPSDMTGQDWQQQGGYNAIQGPALPETYQGEWQDYPPPPPEHHPGQWTSEQLNYSDQYMHSQIPDYGMQTPLVPPKDPRFMTQEEKDRGLGSVFKRDDQRLQQRREKDAREKDPNFISESYSECYPGYQEYNREVVDSDDEDDLTKMDMGGRAKGRLHRWDFETEEEWAKYNEQKEAMPKAAFQFGVKMQDGRKTRKQNKDQKLNNELHKINKILDRKKKEKTDSYDEVGHYDDEIQPGKRLRV